MPEDESPQATTAEVVRQQFEGREEKIRDAAKWLIASFAAVGAALIAGSQLSSIGKLPLCAPRSLDCARLWIAVFGTLASLLGVVFAIWIGVTLLVPDPAPVSVLREEWKSRGSYLQTYFRNNSSLLQGFKDLDDMDRQEADAFREVDRLRAEVEGASQGERDKLEQELSAADSYLGEILERSDVVVSTANHVRFVHAFKSGALKKLVGAASLAALGIVAFAWAANPPTLSPTASLRGADLSGSDLTGVNLRNVDLSNANLSQTNLTGADLRGADLSNANLDDAIWSQTTCPDGTVSDTVGGSCQNHLDES
jgi:uncharacterized protein YjbI with pentapeptide repeats